MGKKVKAGRGLIAIAGAKVYFILTSYAVLLLLPRIFGKPEEFGLYMTTISGVSMLNNVLIAATIQTVSKFVSEDEANTQSIIRQGLHLQFIVGLTASASLFFAAPSLARALLDEQLTPLIRSTAVVVLCYSLYATLVGSLNGRRYFSRQASLDITFSTLRSVGMLGGALIGWGALGTLIGFAGASVLVLIAALLMVGIGSGKGTVDWKRWLSFLAPIWLYQACLNGILLIDIQVMKRSVAELAVQGAQTAQNAASTASEFVAYYGAAQRFAFVPYQLILALTFVVFPMISRATSAGDREQARITIQHAMRFSLLALLAIAAPVAGAADGIMLLAYPADYVVGAPALAILVFGIVAFALFVVSATILSSAGKPSHAAIVAAIALLIVVVLNRAAIMTVGIGEQTLSAAAMATTSGMMIALFLSASLVYRRFAAFLSLRTIARALIAAALAYGVSSYVPHATPLMALVALMAGALTYVLLLLATGEITRADLQKTRASL